MRSKRAQEGYLQIDHRDSPGLADPLLQSMTSAMPPGAGRGLFEAPTITCSHCQRVVILNPLRTRERAYCAKCDHYLCDGCGTALTATGVCRPFTQRIDDAYQAVVTQEGFQHG